MLPRWFGWDPPGKLSIPSLCIVLVYMNNYTISKKIISVWGSDQNIEVDMSININLFFPFFFSLSPCSHFLFSFWSLSILHSKSSVKEDLSLSQPWKMCDILSTMHLFHKGQRWKVFVDPSYQLVEYWKQHYHSSFILSHGFHVHCFLTVVHILCRWESCTKAI